MRVGKGSRDERAGLKEQIVQGLGAVQACAKKAVTSVGVQWCGQEEAPDIGRVRKTMWALWGTSILSQSKWVRMELHDPIYKIIAYNLTHACWEEYLVCIMLTC